MSLSIVHFEIHVADVERAAQFYQKALDWKVEKWEGTDFFGVWAGRSKYPNGSIVGLDGGLRQRSGDGPSADAPLNSFLCTVETEDLDGTLAAIEDAGGAVLEPKSAFPGVGWQALCADPDGNRFSLMQNDPSAGTAASKDGAV